MILPYKPLHTKEWLDAFFKENYYKKPYDRFSWWRGYVPKNKPLSSRSHLRDKILNGDFELSSYKFEAEVVEHRLNEKFALLHRDQGRYIEETSLDRTRRKRLLEDFIKDEKNKLDTLVKGFKDLTGLTDDQIISELEKFKDNLIDFYYYITEKYPRKNGIPYL